MRIWQLSVRQPPQFSKQTVLEPSKDLFGWECQQLQCMHLLILELQTSQVCICHFFDLSIHELLDVTFCCRELILFVFFVLFSCSNYPGIYHCHGLLKAERQSGGSIATTYQRYRYVGVTILQNICYPNFWCSSLLIYYVRSILSTGCLTD